MYKIHFSELKTYLLYRFKVQLFTFYTIKKEPIQLYKLSYNTTNKLHYSLSTKTDLVAIPIAFSISVTAIAIRLLSLPFS